VRFPSSEEIVCDPVGHHRERPDVELAGVTAGESEPSVQAGAVGSRGRASPISSSTRPKAGSFTTRGPRRRSGQAARSRQGAVSRGPLTARRSSVRALNRSGSSPPTYRRSLCPICIGDHGGGLSLFSGLPAGRNVMAGEKDFSYGLVVTHRKSTRSLAEGVTSSITLRCRASPLT